jgi:hypothetical protein
MAVGDDYLHKAAEFSALAERETNAEMRVGFENVSRAYLRLAAQAKRNHDVEITYEPPKPVH